MSAEPRSSACAQFSNMVDSTKADWDLIQREFLEYGKGLPDRILAHLKLLEGETGGFPVDRLTHSLQTATRAHRDGRDEEYVVCALLHDIGDTLGSFNHADVAAAMLKPFVSEKNHWMVAHHGIFQGYYFFHYIGLERNLRETFRGHPNFEHTELFCALYDAPAFDARAATLPLDFFEPMVRRVFAEPRNSIYIKPAE